MAASRPRSSSDAHDVGVLRARQPGRAGPETSTAHADDLAAGDAPRDRCRGCAPWGCGRGRHRATAAVDSRSPAASSLADVFERVRGIDAEGAAGGPGEGSQVGAAAQLRRPGHAPASGCRCRRCSAPPAPPWAARRRPCPSRVSSSAWMVTWRAAAAPASALPGPTRRHACRRRGRPSGRAAPARSGPRKPRQRGFHRGTIGWRRRHRASSRRRCRRWSSWRRRRPRRGRPSRRRRW